MALLPLKESGGPVAMLFGELSSLTSTEGGIVGLLCLAVGTIFWLLVSNYKEQLKSKDDERDRLLMEKNKQLADQKDGFEKQLVEEKNRTMSWKKIAGNAVAIAESGIPTEKRVAQLAAVVGEANSPQTEKEKEDADLQTVRARLTAVTLASGFPARIAEEDTGGGLVPLTNHPHEPHAESPADKPKPMTPAENQQLRDDIAGVKDDTAAIREKIDNPSPPEKAP